MLGDRKTKAEDATYRKRQDYELDRLDRLQRKHPLMDWTLQAEIDRLLGIVKGEPAPRLIHPVSPVDLETTRHPEVNRCSPSRSWRQFRWEDRGSK